MTQQRKRGEVKENGVAGRIAMTDIVTSIPSESMDFETLDPDAWFDDEDNELLDQPVDPINNIQLPPSPPPAP